MRVSSEFPPNFDILKSHFPVQEYAAVFTYGDVIYAPFHEQIPDDIKFHESIHAQQQKLFTSPDVWWNKYIFDTEFRKSQELQAYAAQYQWIKKNVGNKAAYEAITELSLALSSDLYGLGLTRPEAETLIRKYGKTSKIPN